MTSPVRPLRSRLLLPETLPFTDARERRWFYNYRGAGGPRTLDLFLLAGQSNTEGRGTGGPSIAGGMGYQYNGTTLSSANDPVGGADTGSAWPAFAREWFTLRHVAPCFVEQATGGTAIIAASDAGSGNWSDTGELYAAAITAIEDAQTDLAALGYVVNFRGVIWGQGEREAVSMNGTTVTKATYKAGLEDLLDRFRDDLGADTKVWILQTGTSGDGDTDGWREVREAQAEVAGTDALTYLAFTGAAAFAADGKMKPDNLHYTQEGLDEMGTGAASYIHGVLAGRAENRPPLAPTVTVSNVTETGADFAGSSFADADGDTHAATQWQVADEDTFADPVVDTGDDAANLTSYTASGLTTDTATYYIRARYKDSAGSYSDWSAVETVEAVIFSDDFDRADSATTMGAEWSATGTTWGIQSNRAYSPTTSASGQATHDCGNADVDVRCNLVLRSTADGSRGFVVVRSDGTVSNRWLVGMNNTGDTLRLVKTVSGTSTDVDTSPLAAQQGHVYTVRAVANGSAWEVFLDGESVMSATDSALATNTKCGLAATRSTGATGSPTFESFVVRGAS